MLRNAGWRHCSRQVCFVLASKAAAEVMKAASGLFLMPEKWRVRSSVRSEINFISD